MRTYNTEYLIYGSEIAMTHLATKQTVTSRKIPEILNFIHKHILLRSILSRHRTNVTIKIPRAVKNSKRDKNDPLPKEKPHQIVHWRRPHLLSWWPRKDHIAWWVPIHPSLQFKSIHTALRRSSDSTQEDWPNLRYMRGQIHWLLLRWENMDRRGQNRLTGHPFKGKLDARRWG